MKLSKLLVCITIILMTNTAVMANKAPFKLESYNFNYSNYKTLKITFLDNVTLWKIMVNRGNCEITEGIFGNQALYQHNIALNLDKLKDGYKVVAKWRPPSLFNGKYYEFRLNKIYRTTLQVIEQVTGDWEDTADFYKRFGDVINLETNCREILEVELTTDEQTWRFSMN